MATQSADTPRFIPGHVCKYDVQHCTECGRSWSAYLQFTDGTRMYTSLRMRDRHRTFYGESAEFHLIEDEVAAEQQQAA